jgi:hypothetical protein
LFLHPVEVVFPGKNPLPVVKTSCDIQREDDFGRNFSAVTQTARFSPPNFLFPFVIGEKSNAPFLGVPESATILFHVARIESPLKGNPESVLGRESSEIQP